MSQIALSHTERVAALERLGYTGRESQFLVLAALHGGFFLRGQYCRFIGRQVGGTAAELVRKLLANGHATAVAGCHNTKVYHLGARPFYAALGQEDNRNRRERPTIVIKNKLMCLDFVLDHPRGRYLATEQEKVSYFNTTLGIPFADLPRKLFRSPAGDRTTERYFVDKYPMFLSDNPSNISPVVSFCFVDEGLATDSRFDSYLEQYRCLFRRLADFRLIYVSASEWPLETARKTFERFSDVTRERLPDIRSERARDCLLAYFEARAMYETQQFDTFDRATLIRLRDDRQRFSGSAYDALYRVWMTGGASAMDKVLVRAKASSGQVRGTLETVVLPYNYSVFGTVSRISSRGEMPEPPTSSGKTCIGADGEHVVGVESTK